MALLEHAHQQHPTDREILMALVSIARDTGNFAVALRHARELARSTRGRAAARAGVGTREKGDPLATADRLRKGQIWRYGCRHWLDSRRREQDSR